MAVIAFFVGVLVCGVVLITLGSSGSRTTCLDPSDAKGGVYATRIATKPCTSTQLCIRQDPAVGADKLTVTDCPR